MGETVHRNALKPGCKLHWYRIEKVLGQGGFGITYLAYNFNLDRKAAIKEYLPIELAVRVGDNSVHPLTDEHGKQFHWGLERFLSEAKTLARFEHPNIVRVHDVFEGNNTAYMVMSYEEGESLLDMLNRRKTMGEEELMNILIPILGGLELVHASGFIHRDIKPANIFLRKDGSPVLLDFGSARQALGVHTKTLTTLVSPGYAPFEQYHSKSDEQGPWTDIYGLGATLYRAVTGTPPMDALDRGRVILKGERDTFVPATVLGRGHYSERFLKAIDHALQFREEDRPQSIAEWRQEIAHIAVPINSNKPKHIVPVELQTTAPAKSYLFSPARDPAVSPEPAPQPRRWVFPIPGGRAIIFILLFVVAGMVWYFHTVLLGITANLQKGKEVKTLLEDAKADITAQRFVSPPDDNALQAFRKILALDPHNAEARLGLRTITDKLVEYARQATMAEKFTEAEKYLSEAAGVLPDSSNVTLARNELAQNKTEWGRKQAEAKAKQEKLQDALREADTSAGKGDVKATLSHLEQARSLGAEEKALAGIKNHLRASLESLSADAAAEAQAAIKAKDATKARASIQRAREYKTQAEALGVP